MRSHQCTDNQGQDAEDNGQPGAVPKSQAGFDPVDPFIDLIDALAQVRFDLINTFIDLIDALAQVRFDLIDPLFQRACDLVDPFIDLVDPFIDLIKALVNLRKPILKANALIVEPLVHLGTQLLNLIANEHPRHLNDRSGGLGSRFILTHRDHLLCYRHLPLL